MFHAQYTPPTRLNCRVASRRVASAVWIQFATSSRWLPTDSVDNLETGQTDPIAVWLREFWWILITFSTMTTIMSSLLKKLSISIKIGVIKRYGVCFVSFQIVDRIRRQSSWASFELCSRRRHGTTQVDSWVASAVCIGHEDSTEQQAVPALES